MDQLDIIYIYRTFHSKTMNFTFFSSAHRTLSRIDTLLDNQHITEEIKKEIKICIEINENMTTPNLQDSAKAGLRGRFIAIQAYLK